MGLVTKDSDQFAHGLDARVPVEQFFGAIELWKGLLRAWRDPPRAETGARRRAAGVRIPAA